MTTTNVILTDTMHAEAPVTRIELPDGWRRVWTGAIKPGDRFLNPAAARAGEIVWEPVEPDDAARHHAEQFYCLIRRGEGEVGRACERCGARPCKGLRRRFCWACEGSVLKMVSPSRFHTPKGYCPVCGAAVRWGQGLVAGETDQHHCEQPEESGR